MWINRGRQPQETKTAAPIAASTKKHMKNLNKILIAAVVAGALASASRATADEPFLSPHAKANQARVVPGSSINDVNLATNHPAGNAKAVAQAQSLRTVPSTTGAASVGYRAAGADGIAASPKARQQLNERGTQPVMIAPLK
jgi:hypothetical protein